MPDSECSVVGVRFRNAGKIFYFDSAGMRIDSGEYVVVESARGPEIARVVIGTEQVLVNELGNEDLKPVLRLAVADDIHKADDLHQRAHALLPEARRLAGEAGFHAHIDTAEYTLDGRRLTFSFSSEERLDYRDFVRRAADHFGSRVEMRQVGARDRARLAGGYGICGRELCCASWLTTFPAISIRMAKEQELPLNPQKISGLCGRLLCCLSYEEDGYREMRRTLPKIGQRCSTPTGEGRVVAVNILRRQVTLVVEGQRVEVGDRDLGTVVRWDTASKAGTPPPSISRAEAIAQGLIEPTEEDLREPEPPPPADWLSERPAPGPARGRLPSREPRPERSPGGPPPAQRRGSQGPSPQRGGERRPPRGDRGPAGAPPARQQPGIPEGRRFERTQPAPPRPGSSRPRGEPPARDEAPPPREPRQEGRRRRRGGRGREAGGSASSESPQD
ncbi:MAG: hypothetical protein L6Q80_06385 [Dehalococcoidia bacterium]|nr:hypothetical protein [Dehalococcoidia bacterium]RIL03843.1 MAG: hypothetical protein DCC78_03565 [bacterium]